MLRFQPLQGADRLLSKSARLRREMIFVSAMG
jgi:hypothetical protein